MKRKLIPQAATVIAALALFVALGGTSAAVTGGTPFTTHQISGSDLADRSVLVVRHPWPSDEAH